VSDDDDDQPFPEMPESAKDSASSSHALDPVTEVATSDALTEKFSEQDQANMAANRKMRFWAFIGIGAMSILFLLVLLGVLCQFFDGRLIASALGASSLNGWHALILIGVALAIFAAIPLTLLMALVRMISEPGADADTIKLPTTELAKLCFESIKSAFSK
jgi:hypothetical protein